jgi:hypothetical protein
MCDLCYDFAVLVLQVFVHFLPVMNVPAEQSRETTSDKVRAAAKNRKRREREERVRREPLVKLGREEKRDESTRFCVLRVCVRMARYR